MADPIRVLYVDDDVSSLDIRGDILREEHGFDVLTAVDVETAKERLEGERIDCVLSDLEMPDEDGFDFLDFVRTEYGDLPFILFTGHETEDVARQAFAGGATDYVPKSIITISYELLAHRIEQAVDRYRTTEPLKRKHGASGDRLAGPGTIADDGFTWLDGFISTPESFELDGLTAEGSTTENATRETADLDGIERFETVARELNGNGDGLDVEDEEVYEYVRSLFGLNGGREEDAHEVASIIGSTTQSEDRLTPDVDRATGRDMESDSTTEMVDPVYDVVRAALGDGKSGGAKAESIAADERGTPNPDTDDDARSGTGAGSEHVASATIGEWLDANEGSEDIVDVGEEPIIGNPTSSARSKEPGANEELSEILEEIRSGNASVDVSISGDESDAETTTVPASRAKGSPVPVVQSPDAAATNSGAEYAGTDHTETEYTGNDQTELESGAGSTGTDFNVLNTDLEISVGNTERIEARTGADEESRTVADEETTTIAEAGAVKGSVPRADTVEEGSETADTVMRDVNAAAEHAESIDKPTVSTARDAGGPESERLRASSAPDPTGWEAAEDYERPAGLDPEPGDSVLVQCGSHDDREHEACVDLLGGENVANKHVLLVRYKEMDGDRLERIANEASRVKLVSIGYMQTVPESLSGTVETVKINNPNDVRRLGIVVTGTVNGWSKNDAEIVVCHHPLNVLLQYKGAQSVFRFLHIFLSKLRSAGAVSHFHVDPSAGDPQEINTLKPLFDKVLTIDSVGVHLENA